MRDSLVSRGLRPRLSSLSRLLFGDHFQSGAPHPGSQEAAEALAASLPPFFQGLHLFTSCYRGFLGFKVRKRPVAQDDQIDWRNDG